MAFSSCMNMDRKSKSGPFFFLQALTENLFAVHRIPFTGVLCVLKILMFLSVLDDDIYLLLLNQD